MINRNKAVLNSSWDLKSDCVFCKRKAYKWMQGFEPKHGLGYFVSPYLICSYCSSNTFRVFNREFSDKSVASTGRTVEMKWEFMRPMQEEYVYLRKILMCLESEIKRNFVLNKPEQSRES